MLKKKAGKKMMTKKGTKGMTGKKMTNLEKNDAKGNKKAIKKAQDKMTRTYYHGRNY